MNLKSTINKIFNQGKEYISNMSNAAGSKLQNVLIPTIIMTPTLNNNQKSFVLFLLMMGFFSYNAKAQDVRPLEKLEKVAMIELIKGKSGHLDNKEHFIHIDNPEGGEHIHVYLTQEDYNEIKQSTSNVGSLSEHGERTIEVIEQEIDQVKRKLEDEKEKLKKETENEINKKRDEKKKKFDILSHEEQSQAIKTELEEIVKRIQSQDLANIAVYDEIETSQSLVQQTSEGITINIRPFIIIDSNNKGNSYVYFEENPIFKYAMVSGEISTGQYAIPTNLLTPGIQQILKKLEEQLISMVEEYKKLREETIKHFIENSSASQARFEYEELPNGELLIELVHIHSDGSEHYTAITKVEYDKAKAIMDAAHGIQAPDKEESSSKITYILLGCGLLVVTAGGLYFYKKNKKKSEEESTQTKKTSTVNDMSELGLTKEQLTEQRAKLAQEKQEQQIKKNQEKEQEKEKEKETIRKSNVRKQLSDRNSAITLATKRNAWIAQSILDFEADLEKENNNAKKTGIQRRIKELEREQGNNRQKIQDWQKKITKAQS